MKHHKPIENVVIVGAGWVGRQIAARMAQFGIRVVLVDPVATVCEQALQWIAGQELADDSSAHPRGRGNWRAHVSTCLAVEELSERHREEVDLVVESVPEQISVKKRVLRELGTRFPASVIIASNSSYFVPSMLAKFVAHPERFAHLHFHVPVLRDSVADIVGCEATEPLVIERLADLVRRIGHEPLVLRREHPGYIFNWLLQSVLKSALELAARDVADPQTIDKSWTVVTGMPLGPFGIMDQIGLDVIEQVLSNARWAPMDDRADTSALLALISQHTDRGELGAKTGRGFYTYSGSQEPT